jgi:D-sedoheptulose 7-phosphate isomerase
MNTICQYLQESVEILKRLDRDAIRKVVEGIAEVRARGGRLFVLGVGGSAATASHAVNDFRKLCGIEAYCPTDNVAELTARTNDEGWESCLEGWLRGSRMDGRDAVLALSVGGGDMVRGISVCLGRAVSHARTAGASVYAIVGRNGGYVATRAQSAIIIPPLYPERVTPHTEGLTSVVLHLLVSHPLLQRHAAKWESEK